ncbi:hypothetical protein OF83DRAFT_739319 [Amylostereum chailletii]|nr:hypothetical protein OF83DRAFT_739319 [Amylostereum chailletii]
MSVCPFRGTGLKRVLFSCPSCQPINPSGRLLVHTAPLPISWSLFQDLPVMSYTPYHPTAGPQPFPYPLDFQPGFGEHRQRRYVSLSSQSQRQQDIADAHSAGRRRPRTQTLSREFGVTPSGKRDRGEYTGTWVQAEQVQHQRAYAHSRRTSLSSTNTIPFVNSPPATPSTTSSVFLSPESPHWNEPYFHQTFPSSMATGERFVWEDSFCEL